MRVTLLLLFLLLMGCSNSVPTPPEVKGAFPTVQGESLAGEEVVLPRDFEGKVAVLLIGYLQKAQFDIDRWLLGLLDGEVKAELLELPTIEGWIPGLARGFIDRGMRGGIPQEDWSTVVTIYEDASKIVEVIGKENQQNAQVVVLNRKGEIVWFHNAGYSPTKLRELRNVVEALQGS